MVAMLGTEPIFTIHAELADIINLGRTPYGRAPGHRHSRRQRAGTEAQRPHSARRRRLADHPRRRRSRHQARYTIETDAGARILVTSDGLRHGPPDVLERLARGDNVDPALYYFRTVMRFETADPAVDWLNRILALARGQREARAVRLDVYEVE